MNRPAQRTATFHLFGLLATLLAAALLLSAATGAVHRASAQEPEERAGAKAEAAASTTGTTVTVEIQAESEDDADAQAEVAAEVETETEAEADSEAAELLPNGRQPMADLLTGGQPDPGQLEELAWLGYRTVIDLRPAGERGALADEPAMVEALGMRYVRLPVAGADGLTDGNVRALDELLDDPEAYPVVIHCASGNRVGALLALRAARTEGAEPEAALQLGLDAGLTRLEPAVRELLDLPAAADQDP